MHREQKPENRMDVIAADDHEDGAGHLDARALGLVKAAYSVREELLSRAIVSLCRREARGVKARQGR
jgi:hypothetical protein